MLRLGVLTQIFLFAIKCMGLWIVFFTKASFIISIETIVIGFLVFGWKRISYFFKLNLMMNLLLWLRILFDERKYVFEIRHHKNFIIAGVPGPVGDWVSMDPHFEVAI